MHSPLYTASEIDRLMQCSGSASLLQLKNQTQAGIQGTKTHAKYLKPGGLPRNCREWLCGNNAQNAPSSSLDRFEASFEYDPASGQARYLGSNLERWYELSGPNLTSGTLDVWNWWLDSDGLHMRIADLKTGFMQVLGDLPEPEDSWQLRWAACAIWGWLRTQAPLLFDGVPIRLASLHIAWFIPDELGVIQIHDAHLTVEQLETFRRDLASLSGRLINQAGSTWRTGPWCSRCPAFTRCPVQIGIVERIGLALEGPIDDKTIVDLWRATKALECLTEQAKCLTQEYLSNNGLLETRSGYALGASSQKRKVLAPNALEIAHATLDLGDKKVPVKEQLDLEALAEQLGPDAYKLAINILTQAGAFRTSVSTAVRETRRKVDG